MARPPLPPFDAQSAPIKVRAAEDAWNSRDPARVATAYTPETVWRNRSQFLFGRAEVEAFLTQKWRKEIDYRLIKELWAVSGARIAVRFAYEAHDETGRWFRAYGNENWDFAPDGLMAVRHASINDLRITESERLFRWPLGPRPEGHPGLTDLWALKGIRFLFETSRTRGVTECNRMQLAQSLGHHRFT